MTSPSLARRARSALFVALRMSFRLLPIGTARRDIMRNWFLDRFPEIRPESPQGMTSPGQSLEHRARARAGMRAICYVPYSEKSLPVPIPATLVAFYLPQFHTIRENDEWWGKGFTEWSNVTRALPQFEGHRQPLLPEALGYYDLRNPDVLREQARLARTYGVGAFCMYFYWFNGKTLLELPHRQWLDDRSITLPICICWANENWTRSWDGRSDEVLIAQLHSPEDDIDFIRHVAQYLRDPRYLRHEGKPMLLVYRPGLLPDARTTANRWRTWCRDNDIGEIHLVYVQSFERPDPRDIGFDAAVEFPPNLTSATNVTSRQTLLNPEYRGEILDWRDVANDFTNRPMPHYELFPGLNCGWDNEARRTGRGRTYVHATPSGYAAWLRDTIQKRLASTPYSRRKIFINAWNEWAEGAVLEPTSDLGYAALDAVRRALTLAEPRRPSAPHVVIHAYYLDVLDEILTQLSHDEVPWKVVVTTSPDKRIAAEEICRRHSFDFEVHAFENRGRDVLPFLKIAEVLRRRGVSIVLKLHTKRSPHRPDGDTWRRELYRALMGPERTPHILAAFDEQTDLGMVAPEGHILSMGYYWGANASNVQYVLRRIGQPPADLQSQFVSGSMFWLRLESLSVLLECGLTDQDFESESGQVDGTLAHALERVIAECVKGAGYRVAASASVSGQVSARTSRYPYATRS
jgi:lipopolysaccharide biosynthesis protein